MKQEKKKDTLKLAFLPVTLAKAEYAIFSNPNLFKFTKHHAFESVAVASDFIARHNQMKGFFGVYLAGTLIGNCQLVVDQHTQIGELSYSLAQAYWGRGLGAEVVRQLMAYGQKLPSSRGLTAACVPENIASKKVLLKNGFTFVGTKRRVFKKDGLFYDLSFFKKIWSADAINHFI